MRWSVTALVASIVGVIGAILPAMAGQSVGDPDSAVFGIGVALGAAGGFAGLAIGGLVSSRSETPSVARNLAGGAIGVALLALFLTFVLVFSG